MIYLLASVDATDVEGAIARWAAPALFSVVVYFFIRTLRCVDTVAGRQAAQGELLRAHGERMEGIVRAVERIETQVIEHTRAEVDSLRRELFEAKREQLKREEQAINLLSRIADQQAHVVPFVGQTIGGQVVYRGVYLSECNHCVLVSGLWPEIFVMPQS